MLSCIEILEDRRKGINRGRSICYSIEEQAVHQKTVCPFGNSVTMKQKRLYVVAVVVVVFYIKHTAYVQLPHTNILTFPCAEEKP